MVWKDFGEIHRKLFFLYIKVTIAEMSTDIIRKFVFLTMFEKGLIPRKIWVYLNNLFLIKPVKGDKYYQNSFLPKLSHFQLNCAFLLF